MQKAARRITPTAPTAAPSLSDMFWLPIAVPVYHPQNVRKHDRKNIEAIKASLRNTNGQAKPIVLSGLGNDHVLAGNGTLEAMRQLHAEGVAGYDRVRCVRVQGLTPEQELIFVVSDNKTTDMSEFDYAKLQTAFKQLTDAGVDLSVTGFQTFETDPLMDALWFNKSPEFEADPTKKSNDGYKRSVVFSKKQWEQLQPLMTWARDNFAEMEQATDAAVIVFLAEYNPDR